MNRVVVVGAGHAGVEFCDALRSLKPQVEIVLIDEHQGTPFQRPSLSKEGLSGGSCEPTPLRAESYYPLRNIELIRGDGVRKVHPESRRVELKSGITVEYDHLVLATGTISRTADFLTRETLMLRTPADADRIHAAIREAGRIAVIGSGYIGLEVASGARQHGCEVDVITPGTQILQRSVSQDIATALQHRHTAAGIQFKFGSRVRDVERVGTEHRITLANGQTRNYDHVIAGIGVVPNTIIAENAGLQVADGILVNHELLTSDPHISAIGDCARFSSRAHAQSIRFESVQNATGQARFLAAQLTAPSDAEESHYEDLPWFWSIQGDCRLQIAGVAEPSDEAVSEGDLFEGPFIVRRFNENRLTSVETLNSPREHVKARKLLAEETQLLLSRAV